MSDEKDITKLYNESVLKFLSKKARQAGASAKSGIGRFSAVGDLLQGVRGGGRLHKGWEKLKGGGRVTYFVDDMIKKIRTGLKSQKLKQLTRPDGTWRPWITGTSFYTPPQNNPNNLPTLQDPLPLSDDEITNIVTDIDDYLEQIVPAIAAIRRTEYKE